MTKKTSRLKELIYSKDLSFLMEAHDGLSAKIAEEAGFSGLWASGLAISASLGVRDSNEVSWTQVLDVIEFMSDATEVPILVDGDTGHGNFNNVRRFVRKLERHRIAGVCIEDKLYPKTNSFLGTEKQGLASIDEFVGKIKSAKDSQSDDDFVVVARVESLIAGWSMDEALRRAEAYRQAGADAIFIHSKRNDTLEIEVFMREWGNRHPVILVPTKYYTTPAAKFRELGVSTVIWANHSLRASISAMQLILRKIKADEGLMGVEDLIAPLGEVFRLQNAKELEEAEKRYLPPTIGKTVRAVILSRGQSRTMESTAETFREAGVRDIVVIRDIRSGTDGVPSVTESLRTLQNMLSDNLILCYGNRGFKAEALSQLFATEADITVIVDKLGHFAEDRGLWKLNQLGATALRSKLAEISHKTMSELLKELAKVVRVETKLVEGAWVMPKEDGLGVEPRTRYAEHR